jgi:hypothetical protein
MNTLEEEEFSRILSDFPSDRILDVICLIVDVILIDVDFHRDR